MHHIFKPVRVVLTSSVALVLLAVAGFAQPASNLPIRGVVRALNTAAISTDLAVPIKKLNFRKGQGFTKGDVLVAFNCSRFEAERAALLAERKVQSLTVENNLALLKLSAVGRFDLQISQARLAKADAEINRLDVRLSQCVIKAPFNGKVTTAATLQYETPKSGVPFIEIIESGTLQIDFIVPSKWLAWMKPNTRFSFHIDETAKTYHGKVLHLGASVDPVSQTIEVRGKFSGSTAGLFSGMSGSATFDTPGS